MSVWVLVVCLSGACHVQGVFDSEVKCLGEPVNGPWNLHAFCTRKEVR